MPLNMLDYTPLTNEDGNISTANRFLGSLRYGSNWYNEMQAQLTIVTRLKKVLSDRYTLARNFQLPDTEVPIPLMLISAAGIWIIAVSDIGGIFQVRGNDLLTHDIRMDEYIPAKPNLVMQTELLRRAFEDFLKKNQIEVTDIEPVLIFTNPGVDVSTGESHIRVVLIDALNRFATGLLSAPAKMKGTQSKEIVELIKRTQNQRESKARKKAEASPFDFIQRLSYSTPQWIVIGVLLLSLVFVGLLFIALLYAP